MRSEEFSDTLGRMGNLGTPTFSISSLKTETSLSELIHRIGHDIGNPLTSLISLSSLIERSDGDFKLSEEDLKRYAKTIINDAWKIQGISEKLTLILSDRGKVSESVDLQEIIAAAVRKTLRKHRFAASDVLVSFGEGPLSAVVDSSQLEWLICELLANALSSASHCEADTAELSVRRVEEEIEIKITNRCKPIESELSSLFNPFVKLLPEGCGLGLTAAWAVVSRADGRIQLEQSGDTFTTTVFLPAS